MAGAGAASKRVFATTAYEADEEGVLRAVLPSRCVFASGPESCSLGVDHYRRRKTGPRFPVAVVRCSAHPNNRYTLYPPGHVPYGREAVTPSSPSGVLLLDRATEEPVWEATVFAAAVDAAEGEGWPSDSPWQDSRRRRTQGRRLDFCGWLLGVHPGLDERSRERIATRLGVAVMRLREAARHWGADWTTRGAAIVSVLLAISLGASLLDRLLAAGAVAELWAEPRRWEAAGGSWVIGRSGGPERAALGRPRSRGPPPTNSPAPAEPHPP